MSRAGTSEAQQLGEAIAIYAFPRQELRGAGTTPGPPPKTPMTVAYPRVVMAGTLAMLEFMVAVGRDP